MANAAEVSTHLQRNLSNRHLQLIAIGGAIGTGLFLGSGKSISVAGPSILLVYLIIGVALFFALKPGLNDLDRAARLAPGLFALTAVPAIGFYDGLIGPGAGSFYMIAFVTLAGFGVLRATANTKLLNFSSNLGGLIAFALTGHPLWVAGLAMGAGQMAGAWLGARMAVRVGARVIKPLLVVTSTALALRLLWQML